MKHLCCIFLFVFLGLGLIAVCHEEAPDFRTSGNATGNTVGYAASDCPFTISTGDGYTAAHHSLFNDENDGHRVSDALCPGNLHAHNNASPKLLKLKLHLPARQLQHLHSHRLPTVQNPSLSFTPSAIRYSCGYYIFALAHILI